MSTLELLVAQRLGSLIAPDRPALALVLPGGQRIGPADAPVTLRLTSLAPLAHVAAGQVGRLAEDYVEGRIDIEGAMRPVIDVAARLVREDPTRAGEPPGPLAWWRDLMHRGKSLKRHRAEVDARQIQFHYDVSDDFYALWLDPRRVYSCAYFRKPDMTLAMAQEAKLEHICRKLMLRPGERFLDIGAGWGGLLLWAAEQHGVRATGITLSKNQHAHVNRLIDERGLRGRVEMRLLDYRDLPEGEPFDKIASVGMFEHVGRAMLPRYFDKIRRLLRPADCC
jgi:cyclopropane-fatty-acyl-phospholipid synthase